MNGYEKHSRDYGGPPATRLGIGLAALAIVVVVALLALT